jgi:hypothetical protein
MNKLKVADRIASHQVWDITHVSIKSKLVAINVSTMTPNEETIPMFQYIIVAD